MSSSNKERLEPRLGLAQGERLSKAVRSLREERGLSVRTLAKAAGFSASFISQIEHGLASPSIASMEKIAAALGVTLSEFFAVDTDHRSASVIVRNGEGYELASEWSQATLRVLGPSWEGHTLDPVLLTLDPGGRSGAQPTGHSGVEFAIVLSGMVELHLDEVIHDMHPGDSVHLAPQTPHVWRNSTDRQVRILLVSSHPPAFPYATSYRSGEGLTRTTAR